MLPKTNFSNNTTGKLLSDEFLTVRLHDDKYHAGQLREIYLRDQLEGSGKVMSVMQFRLADIPDIIAFMDCGKNSPYLRTLLSRYYRNVTDQTVFDVVVMVWVERIPNKQRDLFTAYWNKLVEQAPHSNEMQLNFDY